MTRIPCCRPFDTRLVVPFVCDHVAAACVLADRASGKAPSTTIDVSVSRARVAGSPQARTRWAPVDRCTSVGSNHLLVARRGRKTSGAVLACVLEDGCAAAPGAQKRAQPRRGQAVSRARSRLRGAAHRPTCFPWTWRKRFGGVVLTDTGVGSGQPVVATRTRQPQAPSAAACARAAALPRTGHCVLALPPAYVATEARLADAAFVY